MKKNIFLSIIVICIGIAVILGGFINSTYAIPDDINNTKIRIYKTDPSTTEKTGAAKLVLLDGEKKVVQDWIATVNGIYKEITGLTPGKYIIKEISIPDNYGISDDMEITVENTSEIQEYHFVNTPSNKTKVSINLLDETTKGFVGGASIVILNENNEEIKTCKTESYAPCLFDDMEAGTYKVKNKATATGYITFSDQEFTVSSNDQGKTIDVNINYEYTKLSICKISSANSKKLAGAKFELKDANNKIYDSWTTDENIHYIERIPVGKYTLVEITAPSGYQKTQDVTEIDITENKDILYVTTVNDQILSNVENTESNDNTILYVIGTILILIGATVLVINISYHKHERS